jgi:peptidoglycan/LPS O-acetylase OafA/YrhL
VAVIGVLLFHNEFSWAQGGFLGVSAFFTLSGFLIATLLLEEHVRRGAISLKNFYSRRFRRLMPASLLALLGICLFGLTIATPDQLQGLRADLLSALGYVANWRFVLEQKSYSSLFSQGSPVQHFWSLAIEEQFYIVFPVLIIVTLRAGGRRLVGIVLSAAIVGSLVLGFLLRSDLNRVYYGTDTRAAELLAGALLAWYLVGRRQAAHATARSARASFAISILGTLAFGVTIFLWSTQTDDGPFVTHGLLPLQAVLTLVVIVAALEPGYFGRILSWRPLVAIGLVSYGLYLFHWPIFLWLSAQRTGLSPWPLFGVRVAVTGAVTVASYFLLEQPIRQRRRLRVPRVALPAIAGGVTLVLLASILVTVNPPASAIPYANVKLGDQKVTIVTAPKTTTSAAVTTRPTTTSTGTTKPGNSTTVPSTTTTLPAVPPPNAVMILGDSAMVDETPALAAAYEQMGSAVIQGAWPGFGLSNDRKWQTDWPPLIAQYHPSLIFMMLGVWDIQAMQKDPGAYNVLLDQAVSILGAQGGRIVWTGILPGGTAVPEQMNPTFRALVARHPGVTAFLDPSPAVRAANGIFPRWLTMSDGSRALARKPDDWHLCTTGAQLIAQQFVQFAAGMRWAPTELPAWALGSWRSDKRYNDPVNGCNPTLNPDPGPGKMS